ncbi:cutinase family protein, partial [Candidatus Saccharibacteria bacterium]|nr:cutinase family protein [Candidatus Saccharibacteria bacterium]
MKKFKQNLRIGAAFLGAVIATATTISIVSPKDISATSTSGCYDLEFVWARGSGSELGALEYQAFENTIKHQLAAGGFGGAVNFYELGSQSGGYPAQKVFEFSPSGIVITLGAKVSAGSSFAYGASVQAGVAELQEYINTRLASCPRTFFALGGYSQGAQVIGEALVSLPAKIDTQVIYSVLYGDPKLYLPEGEGLNPPACRGESLSAYRGWAPMCQTSKGVLGARIPYVQQFQEEKVATYCNAQDVICGSTDSLPSFVGHTTYVEDGWLFDGAQRIVRQAKAHLPVLFMPGLAVTSPNLVTPGQDVVILIDTTGSMNSQIGEFGRAMADVRRLADQVLSGGGRVAMLEYRDTDSMFDTTGGPSRIICGFAQCTDQATVSAYLNMLTADGGGDHDESLLNAIQIAFSLDWRPDASKALVVFTDAGFHDPDKISGWTIKDVQEASIKLNPVNIYVAKFYPEPSGAAAAYHYTQLVQLQELAEATTGYATDGRMWTRTISQMLDEVARRPIARLSNTTYYADAGQRICFDARNSSGIAAELAYADWDWDGDGVFEVQGAELGRDSLRYCRTFDEYGEFLMQVKVVDQNGFANTKTAKYIIADNLYMTRRTWELNLQAEKKLDDEGVEYAQLDWSWAPIASHYQLYVNGVPIGTFDGWTTSAGLYDLDFSRDNQLQVLAISSSRFLSWSEPIMIYAEDQGE